MEKKNHSSHKYDVENCNKMIIAFNAVIAMNAIYIYIFLSHNDYLNKNSDTSLNASILTWDH